jgi:hypothetical protein
VFVWCVVFVVSVWIVDSLLLVVGCKFLSRHNFDKMDTPYDVARQKLYDAMSKLSGSSRLSREEIQNAQESLLFSWKKLESHKVLEASKATPRLYAMISACAGSVQQEADKLADPSLLSFQQIQRAEVSVLLWFKKLKGHIQTLGEAEKATLEAETESNPNLGANKVSLDSL